MKPLALIGALALTLGAGAAHAQSGNAQVRVQPGHFCVKTYCARFSRDLRTVSIQAREPVSIAKYGLDRDPVVSVDTFREIFRLALVQPNLGIDGR